MLKILFVLLFMVTSASSLSLSKEYLKSVENMLLDFDIKTELTKTKALAIDYRPSGDYRISKLDNVVEFVLESTAHQTLPIMTNDLIVFVDLVDKISYWDNGKYVKYHKRYLTLSIDKTTGLLNVTTLKYGETFHKGTVAERDNNPGNLTCSSGTRNLAFRTITKTAKYKGDRKTCAYASEYLGLKDFKNLLSSPMYNKVSIKKDFYKYQDDKVSFWDKISKLETLGINTKLKYKDLSIEDKDIFNVFWAKYEGWYGKSKVSSSISNVVTLNDTYNIEEFNVYHKFSQITRIGIHRR